MEADRNPFPDIEVFPRMRAVGRLLLRVASPLPLEAPDFMSDHCGRGAAGMLDRALDSQPPLPFPPEA